MIKTDIKVPIKYTAQDINDAITSHIPVEYSELSDVRIIKRTLDAKNKSDLHYKMTVEISLSEEREAGLLKMKKKVFPSSRAVFSAPKSCLKSSPVVVGAGPCGLFAALTLAEGGACPIVLERGLDVDERRKRVDAFNKFSILDPECNVQFGEGGAGTYSDGKLKVSSPDAYKSRVIEEFIIAGADAEISYSTTAHLGTDKLSDIVKKIRQKICALGGKFIFSAKLTDIKIKGGRVAAAVYEKDSKSLEIPTDNII